MPEAAHSPHPGSSPGAYHLLPRILRAPSRPSFGSPRPEHVATVQELMDAGAPCMDLLYAVPAWTALLDSWDTEPMLRTEQMLYVHCGGLEGNKSMSARYGDMLSSGQRDWLIGRARAS